MAGKGTLAGGLGLKCSHPDSYIFTKAMTMFSLCPTQRLTLREIRARIRAWVLACCLCWVLTYPHNFITFSQSAGELHQMKPQSCSVIHVGKLQRRCEAQLMSMSSAWTQ